MDRGLALGPGSGPIDAVIFDMDGVLIDSEPLWRDAEVAVLTTVGVPIDDEAAKATTGLRFDEVVGQWYARHPWPGPTQAEIGGRIVAGLVRLVHERGTAMPGALAAVDTLAAAGYPLAIASSSPSEVIAAIVGRLGIGDRFAVLQSAEHEPYGKPHPAVYIEAARRLGVAPTRCLAIEDSPNGVIAAKAARMRCVAVPDPHLRADRRFLAADAALPSLTDLSVEVLRDWLEAWA